MDQDNMMYIAIAVIVAIILAMWLYNNKKEETMCSACGIKCECGRKCSCGQRCPCGKICPCSV